jgi:cytochrome c oxidase subunit 2
MDTTGTLFMPPGQSTIAGDVDALFNFMLYASAIIFAIVIGGVGYFVWRYRARGKDKATSGVAENTKLEITWTAIPLILVIIVFFWGFNIYMKMNVVPKDAIEIKVTAQKWFWAFDYNTGNSTVNELVVPAGKAIKLLMSSKDVIHSFFVPQFRIKMDILPNRYTVTWFEAPNPGNYDLLCTEYCGKGHSEMIGIVRVVGEREYNEWLEAGAATGEGMTLAEYGAVLYKSKACITCHSIDGSATVGPSFKGSFAGNRVLDNGTSIIVDENYIRESILNPQTKIAAGFEPVMPTYQGILKDRQIDAMVEYIKSLSGE